jgi:hypothetical protein
MFWRVWAALLGSSLILGETIRSWGQGRNLLFVFDDYLIGIPLIVMAVLMAKPTVAKHCAFSASYAATAGMLYGSFFGKLVNPEGPMSSNIEGGFLTFLIGLAFLSALAGLVASLYLASKPRAAAEVSRVDF